MHELINNAGERAEEVLGHHRHREHHKKHPRHHLQYL